MSYLDDDDTVMSIIPIEITRYIFLFLPPKWMMKCRLVCFTWKQIIDDIISNDQFWKRYCLLDFGNVFQIAREKCRPSMNSCDLYRTLSFWPKLPEAREEHDEFCSASFVQEEVKGFMILNNGVLGVHKRTAVMYYDIETFKPVDQREIIGDYLRYSENDQYVVLLNLHLHLYISRKVMGKLPLEADVIVDDVKTFILLDHAVYLVDASDDLYICDFSNEKLSMELLTRSREGIMAMGYSKEGLHMLTFERNIFTLSGKKLVLISSLGPTTNLLHVLRQYNFLEMLDWRVYFQWMFILNHSIPQGPLQDIVITRTYGDIVFVGSNWGVLRIYYQPYTLDEFDLFSCEVLKQYNFMERADCPVLSMCPILNIDVYEIHNGHILIVAMPKKIALINYTHKELQPLSISSSLYSEAAPVQIVTYD